jgi:hypothetical protein
VTRDGKKLICQIRLLEMGGSCELNWELTLVKLAGSNVGISSYSHCPYVQRKKIMTNEIAQIDGL